MRRLLVSAGILLYRRKRELEVFLGHPGGPYWANKDEGVWSIPKGSVEQGENLLEAAQREFCEETGYEPKGPFQPLESITMRSGKVVHAWAAEDDFDASQAQSNFMEMEWPPRSGRYVTVPELDEFGWFSLEEANWKILMAHRQFLKRLQDLLAK